MGNSDSKLVLKQGIFRLSSAEPIPENDPYWRGFYELPDSADDLFSLFTSADIRRARDSSPKNIETLIRVLTSRLFRLRQHRSFPSPEAAPEKHALNCIRVLTRILPYIYEEEKLDGWEEVVFWEKRKQRKAHTEVLFADEQKEPLNPGQDEVEELRPLGEELIDTLIDLLFTVGFTVPSTDRSRKRVTYAIWQSGVGCTTTLNATKEMESNRVEVLRLLLTLAGKSLYLSGQVLSVKGVRALTYITTYPDKQIVLSLLCSKINTVLTYNSSTWRVPYDHVVYKDPKQLLVTYALEFLLVILLYPIPEDTTGHIPRNNFRHFLGRLHRLNDFEFLSEGIIRTLKQPMQITSSYLPGSQKALTWIPEMIMLFWETLQCNKRFRSYIIDGERKHDYMILMLFYAHEYRFDTVKQGVVRMCVFVLQTLSTEANFGKLLNSEVTDRDSIPSGIRAADFRGTYGDFLVTSIHNLMTASKGKLDAIYPSLLATLSNIAPYLEQLSPQATSKLIQLYNSMSSPSFLLANETNHALLHSLLESINSILEHQYASNTIFVQGVFKNRKRFEALRSLTLESGQEELERLIRRRKEEANSDVNSPQNHSRNSSVDSMIRNPQSARSPALTNVPENGAFAIGDDEDSDEETQETPLSPAQSSPSGHESRATSISSVEPVPSQLRGMSEKARGKMPAGATSFSRQNSSASLSQLTPTTSHPGVFVPTPSWIDTWLSDLPLHTILTLLSHASPPKLLPDAIEPTAPRLHLFEWTPLSLGWYESLLWGFIFSAEMVVQNGTVGVWNGTFVRLFRVQQEQAKGPSLMKPMGAVDAVGSRIVNGIGSLRIRGAPSDTTDRPAGRAIRDV